MHLNIPFLAGRMDHGITAVLEQFLQAEQLLKQGHWSQAHYLLEDVLHYMPQHIHSAAHDEQTKPCQMACLITGLRDAAIAQSEIFNNIGQYQRAFDVLNQAYALLQFLSIEEIDSMRRLNTTLCQVSEYLLRHINAFCYAQLVPNGSWNINKWRKHTSTLTS